MRTKWFNWFSGAGVVFAVALLVAPVARAQAHAKATDQLPLHFTAFAADLSPARTTAIGPRLVSHTVDIDIRRWTTDAQRDQLLETLRQKGENGLLNALQDQPRVGSIRTPDTLAYDLRYAREEPWGDGGRRIVLVTDRPIGFWEAASQSRMLDYPFTLIEMHLNADGTGEGKMSLATKITITGDTLTLENWNATPVQLTSIKEEK
jgi:hypothetical protein